MKREREKEKIRMAKLSSARNHPPALDALAVLTRLIGFNFASKKKRRHECRHNRIISSIRIRLEGNKVT
jgi:hypothetical protein